MRVMMTREAGSRRQQGAGAVPLRRVPRRHAPGERWADGKQQQQAGDGRRQQEARRRRWCWLRLGMAPHRAASSQAGSRRAEQHLALQQGQPTLGKMNRLEKEMSWHHKEVPIFENFKTLRISALSTSLLEVFFVAYSFIYANG